jgi:hypothetical protein
MASNNPPPNILKVAEILNVIGKEMNGLVPVRAKAAGRLREYMEVLSINRSIGYTSTIGTDQASLKVLQQYLRDNSVPRKVVNSIKLSEKSIGPNGMMAEYYNTTEGYPWYVFLLILAVFASIYILRWEDPIFLAPISYFVVNCTFLIISSLENARYIENENHK